MKRKFTAFLKVIKENRFIAVAFFLIFLVFIVNTLHFFYPDEFENIVGGYFINQGKLPYIGFFTHHAPFGHFFSSFITLFTGASFVKFRFLLAVVYFLMMLVFFLFLRKRFGKKESSLFLVLTSFIAIGATYFWGHMILADSLVGYLLIPVYIILFLLFLKKEAFRQGDIFIISILTFLSVLTSFTFIFAAAVVYLFTLYWYFSQKTSKLFNLQTLKFFLILMFPALIFLVYLLATRSLYDFYYQAIFFTKEYYISSETSSPNPIRYAVMIFSGFLDHYRALLIMTKDLNFGSPFNSTLALSNVFMIIYLIIKRKPFLAVFVSLLLIYLNARSDPYSSQETDYQAIPYDYFSLFNGIFLLHFLWEELKAQVDGSRRLIFSFFLLTLGIFYIFLSLSLFSKGFDKAYKKYMGVLPLIYDRPVIANTLNSLLDKEDYYYIGPFAFEEHLYAKANLASRYFVTIPAMDRSEKIKSELLEDIRKNKPKVVVYNVDDRIFGVYPGRFLVEYLEKNYFVIAEFKYEKINHTFEYKGRKFRVENPSFGSYDFTRYFFFDRQREDEIMERLIKEKLISPI